MHLLKTHDEYKLSIFIWLITLTIMVLAIIIIGGLTRLTDSGLSMVDWQPILGTIPPLSLNDWNEKFELYKLSPEYLYVNKNMSLVEFKYIFWWEWFHRFFARFLGLVFILPLIVFIFQKKIQKKLFFSLVILFCFGLFQAIVGWWMVKSGLTDNPYVSSYRLTFHLSNAVIILSILLWLTLDAYYIKSTNFLPKNKMQNFILILIFLLFVTIISGAFMAGSHAGQSYNTFPYMNGQLIPEDYFIKEYGYKNFFENVITINFNHRWLATITFTIIIVFLIYNFLTKRYHNYNFHMLIIFLFAILQFLLGILTLLSNVEIILASLHQVNSMLLLASIIFFYHSIKKQ